ncbi:RHS repeat-associated core domain-containing protein [Paraburkholderia solisilvae]|uniref:RHS repeat-associated core domain-containing protein n=1 Tax=Paraburkholderia solisilvae TaxID=624376 RepID=A0A6J5EKI4_9BURK|nr:RHS repeat-associated core domain-containing protein [Paraburkholderia solisilvae]CAB3767060.1 hypothetical protein LMG29739_04967 [Paraburkholderia solisilvae]
MALQLIGTDLTGSALLALSDGMPQDLSYAAFGCLERGEGIPMSIPGFNGERNDPMSGVTHLGNGYRAFNPALMRFNCPDRESPFGLGGINAYAYCANDPINRIDPSGKQFMVAFFSAIFTEAVTLMGSVVGASLDSAVVGAAAASVAASAANATALGSAALGVTGLALGIASGVEAKHGNEAVAAKLKIAHKVIGTIGKIGSVVSGINMLQEVRKLRPKNPEFNLHDYRRTGLPMPIRAELEEEIPASSRRASSSQRVVESNEPALGQSDHIAQSQHVDNDSGLESSLEADRRSGSGRMNNGSGGSVSGNSNSSNVRPCVKRTSWQQELPPSRDIPSEAIDLQTLGSYTHLEFDTHEPTR